MISVQVVFRSFALLVLLMVTTTTTTTRALCESELEAVVNCYFTEQAEICSTLACTNEINDLDYLMDDVGCAEGVAEVCEAFTCCPACANLGRIAVNCAAKGDGCQQRCGSTGSSSSSPRTIGGGLVALLTMAILGSAFTFAVSVV